MVNHIAVIPDGNRRWAKEKGMLAKLGHKISGEYSNISKLLSVVQEKGIPYFSIWAFSTENWKRSEEEVEEIFATIEKGLVSLKKDAIQKEIRFIHFGRKDRIPHKLKMLIEEIESETSHFTKSTVCIGIDYGGKDEILRAVQSAISDEKKIIREEDLDTYFDLGTIPDPEIIIRTGGEKRLSGFLPYNTSYSELFFVETLFPDFKPEHIEEVLKDFEKRTRRFGS